MNYESASVIMSIIAIGISVVSLLLATIFTLIGLKISHRHNKNTVKPIGQITVDDYDNKIGVYIENAGNGPMVINKFIATYGDATANNLIELMEDLPNGFIWSDFIEELEKRSILPGKNLVVLQIIPDNRADWKEIITVIRAALKRIKISIEYTDIYNQYFICERKLTFFARTLEKKG